MCLDFVRISRLMLFVSLFVGLQGRVEAQLEIPPRPRFGVSGLKVPEGDLAALQKFIEDLKQIRTRSDAEFVELQKATKTAADRILVLDPDPKSEVYQSAKQASLLAEARILRDLAPAEQRALVAKVKDYLKDRSIDRFEAALAMTTARELEYSPQVDLAAEAYETFSKTLTRSDSAQIRASAGMMSAAVRRLTLVGKPLKLTGATLTGEPFEIQSMKGKVVLVDFWATWCGPCRAELPNIKSAYEQYHDRGFEVVGVNLDDTREAAEQFISQNEIPWINLRDENIMGGHPAMRYYGIFGIPAMFLVGRDGNVISIRARGSALQAALKKEFGESE